MDEDTLTRILHTLTLQIIPGVIAIRHISIFILYRTDARNSAAIAINAPHGYTDLIHLELFHIIAARLILFTTGSSCD